MAEAENVLHQICGPGIDWSRVNTAESIVGVQTPLSWSFWDDAGELGFRLAYCELGFLPAAALAIPADVGAKFTAIFHGRAATNVSAFRAALDAMPFSATGDAEQSFFSSRSSEARTQSSRRRRLAAALRLPSAALALPRRLAKLRGESEAFWRESQRVLREADLPTALQRFELAFGRFSHEVAAQIVASTVATLFTGRIQRTIARELRGSAEAAEALELRLLGGFGNMEEIRVSADLWEVARGERELADFLARHGFRGPADGELSSRSWREDPKPIEALLAPYRELPEAKSPRAAERRRAAEREAAGRELLEQLRGRRRLQARALLRLSERYVPLRVIAKAAFQQTFDVARAAARRIGSLHVEAGRIERVDDVFHLTREELADPPADARARIEARSALRRSYQALDLPLEFSGMPEPFSLRTEPEAGVALVTGLGVSPGIAEGRARVVLDPSRGELLPGEILVCSITDPSWSSYFLLAAGVVIDVGGSLSHGAIVARELGIPCVINTVDGSRRLRSGDRLRIDGSTGRVEVLGVTRDAQDAPSRVALHELLATLREIDEHYVGSEDVAEGHRYLMHLLGGGLDLFFEADPAQPEFRPTLHAGRKFYGDNPDAIYHAVQIRSDLEYRIWGNIEGADYMSFTVEGGADIDERYPPGRVVATRNDAALDIAADGSYALIASQRPQPGNWLPLAPDACGIVTRHYFEGERPVDRRLRIPLAIELLRAPGAPQHPPPPPDDAAVARGLRRVQNFVRGLSLDYARNGPSLALGQEPNTFSAPSPWDDDHPAVDQSNLSARFELADDEALLIDGRFPRCRFANLVLWNRHLQTFEYRRRRSSLNRRQTRLRPDRSFRIVVAHADPGLPNWLDTAGARSGLIFVRYLLPEEPPQPLSTRVVKLAELR